MSSIPVEAVQHVEVRSSAQQQRLIDDEKRGAAWRHWQTSALR